VLAILSDYDISNKSQIDAARQILNVLRASAVQEEANGFNPSGAPNLGLSIDGLDIGRGDNENVSCRSMAGWKSQTDDTSQSQEMSMLDLEGLDISETDISISREDSPNKSYTKELDCLDEDDKERALLAMFPILKPFDIEWTLHKICKGDAGLAIDELMTQSFLEETGSRHRGIDAFSESDLPARQRKGKGKKKKWIGAKDTSTSSADLPLQSKWDTGKQDVEFLVSKTSIPNQQITSIYHKNGASLSKTISAIIEAHAAIRIDSDDPMVQITASELRQDFPLISSSDLETLVQVAYPSTANAIELAKALMSHQDGQESPIQLEFRHAPISLRENTKPKAHNAIYPDKSLDAASATALAYDFTQKRNGAFVQAASAYRKGKSDPLFGGAAAFYADLGRDFNAKAKNAQSAAADVLVASQASEIELDLHRINVKDAVRISREAVTRWWHEMGDTRASSKGVSAGYKIVTGLGHHSEGGVGKIGPAVAKMLLREGWTIEILRGHLIVTGVRKR